MKIQLFIFGIFFCSIFCGCSNTLQKEHDKLDEEADIILREVYGINNRANYIKKVVLNNPLYLSDNLDSLFKEAESLESIQKTLLQRSMTYKKKLKIHQEKHGCE